MTGLAIQRANCITLSDIEVKKPCLMKNHGSGAFSSKYPSEMPFTVTSKLWIKKRPV